MAKRVPWYEQELTCLEVSILALMLLPVAVVICKLTRRWINA